MGLLIDAWLTGPWPNRNPIILCVYKQIVFVFTLFSPILTHFFFHSTLQYSPLQYAESFNFKRQYDPVSYLIFRKIEVKNTGKWSKILGKRKKIYVYTLHILWWYMLSALLLFFSHGNMRRKKKWCNPYGFVRLNVLNRLENGFNNFISMRR